MKIPNYNTTESIGKQRDKMFKEIELMKRNSLILGKKQQEYFKDEIIPENTTPNMTTEEFMNDLIKLREQFRQDIKEISKDFTIINEVVADPDFQQLEILQNIIQIWPQIRNYFTQGKEQQRFMSAPFITQTIKKFIDDWKKNNSIKDVPAPQPIADDLPVPPNIPEVNVDAELTSADFSKPIDITPFTRLTNTEIDDVVNKYIDYVNNNNLINSSDEPQLKTDLENLINEQNGYNSDLILTNLLIERIGILKELETYKSSLGTTQTRSQTNILQKLEKDLKNNELNFNSESEKLNNFKVSHAKSLGEKSKEGLKQFRKSERKRIREENRLAEEERIRLEAENKRIEQERLKTQITNDAPTDLMARNTTIDWRVNEIEGKTKAEIKKVLDARKIAYKSSDNKATLLSKLNDGLRKKDLTYQVKDIKEPFFGLGFINKEGKYVPNMQIGKSNDVKFVPNTQIGKIPIMQIGKGLSHSKYKNIKIGRGLEIPEEKKPAYLQFGNFIIHQKQLFEDNILNLKYKTMGSTLIKRQLISQNLSDLIKHIIEYGKIQQKDYDILSDNEKKLFDDVIDKALLRDIIKYNRVSFGNGIKNPDMVNINDEIKRFTLLKGIISAGNDNQDLINEFKVLLKKFIDNNRINPVEGNIILNML